MKKIVLISLATAASAMAFSQNLLTNPSFSTGDFTGWSVQQATAGSFYGLAMFADTGDTYSAFFAAFGTQDDILYQPVSGLTVGGHYKYSFSYSNNGTPSQIDGWFQSTGVFDANNPGNVFSLSGDLDQSGAWIDYSYTVTATASTMYFGFGGQNSPQFAYLDNANLSPVAAPEPASMALLGLGAVALLRRRRR